MRRAKGYLSQAIQSLSPSLNTGPSLYTTSRIVTPRYATHYWTNPVQRIISTYEMQTMPHVLCTGIIQVLLSVI
jgi:hypothetical protein